MIFSTYFVCETVNDANMYKLFIKIAIVKAITEGEKNEESHIFQNICMVNMK